MADGALVVIFPEGTSSRGNGETVLPFRTSLLEPAVQNQPAISVAWLHYELADGDARDEVCYWGDHVFFPHVIRLLGRKSVRATIRFGQFQERIGDRKELARRLHAAVMELKTGVRF
jgi:1-acyl-sn-glycerol-3-phosphate acyltransferase